jgi:hypothetical protein
MGIINNEDARLIIEDRNYTLHMYDEYKEFAAIYEKIKAANETL